VTNAEFKEELEQRTKRFAVALVNWLDMLPERRAVNVLVYQLAKSGTAMGANYREANKAESKADFSHKISVVEKESNETVFGSKSCWSLSCFPSSNGKRGSLFMLRPLSCLNCFPASPVHPDTQNLDTD